MLYGAGTPALRSISVLACADVPDVFGLPEQAGTLALRSGDACSTGVWQRCLVDGNVDRLAMQHLLAEIEPSKADCSLQSDRVEPIALECR